MKETVLVTGGSGYIGGAGVSAGTLTAGSGTTPPNTGDADYVWANGSPAVGVGGATGGQGGNGLVIISW